MFDVIYGSPFNLIFEIKNLWKIRISINFNTRGTNPMKTLFLKSLTLQNKGNFQTVEKSNFS